MIKIFFFGNPEIAIPSLEALAKDTRFQVVGVGVSPDKPVGRKKLLTPMPVKKAAQKWQLPLYEISDKEVLKKVVSEVSFDIGVVIAFGMIFPEIVLQRPPKGFVNVHFSLLPKYRGASPIQSAILAGESKSGITIQKMAPELDAGDILHQVSFSIAGKNALEVSQISAQKSAEVLGDTLFLYAQNRITPKAQNHEKATYCQKIRKQDGAISPEKESAETIYRKFLAFTPWPGIFLPTEKGPIKLLSISIAKTPLGKHVIPCAEGAIAVHTLQLPGKKPLPTEEVLKGNPNIFAKYQKLPIMEK